MSAPYLLNNATRVYIGKSGRPVDFYDKNAYIYDRELYEKAMCDIKQVGGSKISALILWQILANNAEGFIYKFSQAYFYKYWNYDASAITHAKRKLIKLGYLVPVEKKPYNYIFYADANGLLWERDKEAQKRISEKYQKRVEKNAAHREEWFAKVAERDRLKEEQQQNNGSQSDKNKEADAE